MYTESEVLDFVEEEDVKFIRLAFFDLNGKQKNISIMPNELHRAFSQGISFDASAVTGFESPNMSDLFLHPDPSTLAVLPWRPTSGKVVRMFCEIRYADGKPYEKDCRYLLKTAVQKAKEDLGLTFQIGTEIEFYLFKLNENGENTSIPFDNATYMDIAPDDKGENIRRDICFTLEDMGITPEASHHEEGPGQNEIDFHYADALTSADNASTFKWIVRTKASANGLYADFSPKPLSDKAGSGFHINISCKNIRNPKENTDYTSQIAAGILKHLCEITFFLNPTENSYERLGRSKAPHLLTWGNQNRSSVIRIPAFKEVPRLELRTPDPETNPYIAFTLLIHAAMDGIKNNLEPVEKCSSNLFELNEKEAEKFQKLPDTVDEAKKLAKESEFVRNVLGNIIDFVD